MESTIEVTHLATLHGHAGPLHAVRFCPHSNFVVSAAEDYSIRVWDVPSRSINAILAGEGWNLTFAPDGRLMAYTEANTVYVRGLDGRVVARLAGHEPLATGVAFSPSGRVVATGDASGHLRIWSALTWQVMYESVPVPEERAAIGVDGVRLDRPIHSLTFAPKGTSLAFTCKSADGTIHLWTLEEVGPVNGGVAAHPICVLSQPDEAVCALSFAPQGHVLAVVVSDRSGVWLSRSAAYDRVEALSSPDPEFIPESVAFSPDGRFLGVAADDGVVWFWEVGTGRIAGRLAAHVEGWFPEAQYSAIGDIDWSHDGRLIATCGAGPGTNFDYGVSDFVGPSDYTVKLWNVRIHS